MGKVKKFAHKICFQDIDTLHELWSRVDDNTYGRCGVRYVCLKRTREGKAWSLNIGDVPLDIGPVEIATKLDQTTLVLVERLLNVSVIARRVIFLLINSRINDGKGFSHREICTVSCASKVITISEIGCLLEGGLIKKRMLNGETDYYRDFRGCAPWPKDWKVC